MPVINVSNEVVWGALKQFSSFAKAPAPNGVRFSTEPFNPANIHKQNYSALANADGVLTVVPSGGDFELVSSDKSAVKARKPSKSAIKVTLKFSQGAKKNNAKILELVNGKHYRKDLKSTVLKRYTKLYKAGVKSKTKAK